MTRYEFLLFIHIAAAAAWVGGGLMMQLFAIRAMRTRDMSRVAAVAGDIEWIGSRVLIPMSLTVLAAGIWLVADSDFWSFGDDWLVIGLVLFAVTALAGMTFFGPEAGRISKLIAAEGESSPAAQARLRRLFAITRADLVLLFFVIFDMTTKPTWDDTWLWIAVAVAAALAFLLVRSGLRTKF